MSKSKTILSWVLVAFFAICIPPFFPSFSNVFALLAIALVLPIAKWQEVLQKFIKAKLKIVLAIVLVLLMIFTAPTTGTPAENENGTSTHSTVVTTTVSTTANTPTVTSNPTTHLTTATTTAQTTIITPTTKAEIIATTTTTAQTTIATTKATTQAVHIHKFREASCTTPKVCSCGATEGAALGHNYKNGSCSRCGTKDPNHKEITYVLNTETRKFHKLSCGRLPTNNRKDTTLSRKEIIAQGYSPCGICHP